MEKRNNILYGRKPLIDALSSDAKVDKILLQKDNIGPEIAQIKSLAANAGISIQMVPREKIERVVGSRPGKNIVHQGVVAFLSLIDYVSIEDIIHFAHERKEDPLFLILDGVTDVHNFGAIARSAECFGVHGIIIPEGGSAQINPEAIKASAGALTKLNVAREKSLLTAIKYLKASGINIIGTDVRGAAPMKETNFNCPCAIVLGAEGSGISAPVLKLIDENFKIPMKGKTESLNVSVSAGVILYHVLEARS